MRRISKWKRDTLVEESLINLRHEVGARDRFLHYSIYLLLEGVCTVNAGNPERPL